MSDRETGSNKGVFRRRDVFMMVIIALSLYISFSGESGLEYSIDPCWYFFDKRNKTPYYASVSPIITDLDGDGSKETVLITKELELKVLSAKAPNEDYSSIYSPEVIYSSRLTSSQFNTNIGMPPVAMAVGYIEPYSATVERSQVIVVVRDDWTVICYDSSLKILWEKAIAHKSHEMDVLKEKFHIEEITIKILPVSLKKGSKGLIVVGASMTSKGDLDTPGSDVRFEHGLDMKEDGNKEHIDMHAQAALEHFNIYALDSHSGHVIWRHDGLDVHQEQYKVSLPQHAFKLDARELNTKAHHAPGTSDWNVFRDSLLSELPHDWSNRADTSIRLAHFERHHIGSHKRVRKAGGKQKMPQRTARRNQDTTSFYTHHTHSPYAPATSASAKMSGRPVSAPSSSGKRSLSNKKMDFSSSFKGFEIPPLSLSAKLPHDAAEHTEYPNVIVAHTKRGVEVVSLLSGAPITSLALNEDHLYTDLNGDGIVDEALVLGSAEEVSAVGHAFSHDGGELKHCSLVVLSGLPAHSQLFNGTLCKNSNSLQDATFSKRSNKYNKQGDTPDLVVAAPPIELRKLDPKTGGESHVKDVVVAINAGVVTAYTGEGSFRWQQVDTPLWDEDYKYARVLPFDVDASRVDDVGSHNTVHSQVLIVGDKSIALLSREGRILAHIELPRPPIAPPIIGDFDSDGVVDVIITTEESILGYRFEVMSSTRGVLIATVIFTVIAALTFILNIRKSYEPEVSGGSQSQSIGTKMQKMSVLSIKRATDEYHLD